MPAPFATILPFISILDIVCNSFNSILWNNFFDWNFLLERNGVCSFKTKDNRKVCRGLSAAGPRRWRRWKPESNEWLMDKVIFTVFWYIFEHFSIWQVLHNAFFEYMPLEVSCWIYGAFPTGIFGFMSPAAFLSLKLWIIKLIANFKATLSFVAHFHTEWCIMCTTTYRLMPIVIEAHAGHACCWIGSDTDCLCSNEC